MTEKEREIFVDIYKFYNKHRDAKTEEEWGQVVIDLAHIDTKHNATLCRNLLIAACDSLPNNK